MGFAPPTSYSNTGRKENAVWRISKNKRRMETRNQILSMIQKFGNPAKNASRFKFGGWGWSWKERDHLEDLDVHGRVILKRILKEWSSRYSDYGTDWTIRSSNPFQGKKFYLFSKSCGPPSLLFNGYLGYFSGMNRPRREVDYLPPPTADVKN